MNTRVIFVGAGPVGLMTAIQAKLYDPDLQILMLEKYTEYKRKHPLLLDQGSFKDTHPDFDFQRFVHQLPGNIRTNELEDALLNYAKKLGIIIEYTPVTNCQEIASLYPDAEIIVGADGSHSVVHEQIFNHEYQIKKTLQYIAEIKYEVNGKTRELNKFTEVGPTISYADHFVSEFVGKEKEGLTPVSLRIFVDEKIYEKMKGASFKNPYHLTDINQSLDSEIVSLYKSIHAWIMAREQLAGEKRIENSERITVTNLPVYASTEFAKEVNGKTWLLVGDAAFGVPYFRSLNNGILCSSQLAKSIHAKINNLSIENELSLSSSIYKKKETPIEHYANYVQQLVKKENFVAELKNVGVNSLQSTAAISQVLPISRMKLMTTTQGKEYKENMDKENLGKEESPSISSLSIFSKSCSNQPNKIEDTNEQKNVKVSTRKSGCNIF